MRRSFEKYALPLGITVAVGVSYAYAYSKLSCSVALSMNVVYCGASLALLHYIKSHKHNGRHHIPGGKITLGVLTAAGVFNAYSVYEYAMPSFGICMAVFSAYQSISLSKLLTEDRRIAGRSKSVAGFAAFGAAATLWAYVAPLRVHEFGECLIVFNNRASSAAIVGFISALCLTSIAIDNTYGRKIPGVNNIIYGVCATGVGLCGAAYVYGSALSAAFVAASVTIIGSGLSRVHSRAVGCEEARINEVL